MPAPQAVPSSVPGGVGLYYVPPGNEPPNLFAAFWHNYLVARSPYAQAAYKQTLAAQDPKSQYAALAAIAKAREAMMAEEGKMTRATMTAQSQHESQTHADYRSKLAWDAAIHSAQIRGNATMGAARYNYEGDVLKAGVLDTAGQQILGDYRTRSEAAQRALAEALQTATSPDDPKVQAAALDYQRAVSNARDAADNLPPQQQDALARAIQAQPMLISDPDLQDAMRTTQASAFGTSRPPPLIDLGGVGYSGGPPEAPPPEPPSTSTRTSTSTSAGIANRVRAPVGPPAPSSAGPPGSSPAPSPSPTTSGSTSTRAGGQPGGTAPPPPSPASSSSAISAPRETSVAARSSAGDPFADLEAQVKGAPKPASPADFNFYGRGFGVYGRDKEARAEPSSRGHDIARRARKGDEAAPPPAPSHEAPKSPYPATAKPLSGYPSVASKQTVGATGADAVVGPPKPAADAKAASKPVPGAKTADKLLAQKEPTAAPGGAKAARPAGAGMGDVKVAEAQSAKEEPGRKTTAPYAGAGDVKVAEARHDAEDNKPADPGVFGKGGTLDQRVGRGVVENVRLGAQTLAGKGGLIDQAVEAAPLVTAAKAVGNVVADRATKGPGELYDAATSAIDEAGNAIAGSALAQAIAKRLRYAPQGTTAQK